MDYGILSVLPSIVAVVIALIFKDIMVSLILGTFLAFCVITDWNVVAALNELFMSWITVFAKPGNAIIIIGIFLIGGSLHALEKSGGINGLVELLSKKLKVIKSRKGAEFFTWIVGCLLFTSGMLSEIITGAVSKPVNDHYNVPPEKQALIVHTTAGPVCLLIPLSMWGAFMIGLLQAYDIANPAQALAQSIPLNFYCIIAVISIPIMIFTGKDFGPMKKIEERYKAKEANQNFEAAVGEASTKIDGKVTSASNIIVPMAALIGSILIGLFITGNGSMLKGNSNIAVLWATMIFIVVTGVMYIKQKIFTYKEFQKVFFQGCGSMANVVVLLTIGFAMAGAINQLGTGAYLASVFAQFINPAFMGAIAFVAACVISFSTGTPMGTMAVAMPLIMPMALQLGANPILVAAAVFGGSSFGGHGSPISGAMILACSTTGCDVQEHIKTQVPYAVGYAAISLVLYVIAGFIL